MKHQHMIDYFEAPEFEMAFKPMAVLYPQQVVEQVEPDVVQPAPAAPPEEEKASVTPPAQTP